MQSCLEKYSIEERTEELVRSDYTRDNQYSSTHNDALATGDAQGKGTGHGGHTHWLPSCTGTIGTFNYSNFDTLPASGAGNNDDNTARTTAFARSLYNYENQYSSRSVDTSLNVADGQYQIS